MRAASRISGVSITTVAIDGRCRQGLRRVPRQARSTRRVQAEMVDLLRGEEADVKAGTCGRGPVSTPIASS